jgi:hypothetical protein
VGFGSAVSENRFRETVKNGDCESGGVARLINLFKSDVVTDDFNSILSSERLLADAAIITNVGDNVEA